MAGIRYTAAEREKLITAYKASQKTQNIWCKENSIGTSTLSKWLKNSAHMPNPEQNWMPVEISSPKPKPAPKSALVIEIGSCKIYVSEEFSKALLADVVKVLVDIC